ncbi:hypothetical protein [Paraburkholderia sp. J12]|uniref:hypothetical protein n=1 Tax=Paraburkholderia sp. J12 TaxID=2805432 RepID=UPI002ABE1F68|nr:hypothetical protein [Paraburkholderia sp. J12]
MRKALIPIALCVLSAVSGVAHAQRAPALEDCPATVQAKHALPRLRFDAPSHAYRSAIKEAARGPINFAGHYILAEWGCGAGCIMAAAVDTATGRVTSLPFTVSDWPLDVTKPLTYRANSCLLIVRGSRNESAEHGTYYYRFDGNAFRLGATVLQPAHQAHRNTQITNP